MGAGHCQWGGYTDRIACNNTWRGTPRIALSCDASAWDFWQIWHLASHSGNLPVLGHLFRWNPLLFNNIWQIWHLASHSGNLPVPGDLSRGSPLSFYNIWQDAKISWHAANSASPDPLRPWMDQNLAPVTKSRRKNLFFALFWPWPLTFDPDLPKIGMRSSISIPIPKIMSIGPLVTAGEAITIFTLV